MKVEIASSVNAGCAVTFGNHKFVVDLLHDHKTLMFSTITPERFETIMQMEEFKNPEVMVYTHPHPDHYSEAQTKIFLEKNPGAPVLGPVSLCDPAVDFSQEEVFFEKNGMKFYFFHLVHEGERYKDVILYSFIVEADGKIMLFPGDCSVPNEQLVSYIRKYAGDRKIDLAVMNFPWLATTRGREFVKTYIHPTQLVINHVPLEEDDQRFHFREGTFKEKDAFPEYKTQILSELYQKVTVEI